MMKLLLWFCLFLSLGLSPAGAAITALQKTDDGLVCEVADVHLRLTVWSERIVRVTSWVGAKQPSGPSLAVIAQPVKTAWTIQEKPDFVVLRTAAMEVRVARATGVVSFFDAAGKPVAAEAPDGIRELKPSASPAMRGQGYFATRQGFELAAEEAIYGLGQHQSGAMNYRGQSVRLAQKNTEIGVPMLISSRGYGILWDNPAETEVSVGVKGNELAWASLVADSIDYYFFYGPDLDQVIAGYRTITGAAPMFGRWGYGFWQSKNRYNSQQELLGVLEEYRKRQIPIDGIVQDWFYWVKGTWGSHQFDPKRFPDPAGMVRRVHELNAHIMLSVWAKFEPGSENYKTFNDMKAFYSGYYDAFNPKARELYWSQIKTSLFDLGFDAWWQDATEPEMTIFDSVSTFSGRGAKVRNAYPLMTTQANYEGQRATTSDKRVFILTRSAYAGQQRNAAVAWSGDIRSDWETFQRQIPAGLNFMASGMPYWTSDIGGFFGNDENDPDYRECFVRWFQYGTFCPIFRVHGTAGGTGKTLWSYGPEAERIMIDYDRLRYRLLPYIYSLAHQVTANGYTIMRPLVMDYPQDTKVHAIPDQFMFGPAFLVAPVTESRGGSATAIPPTNLFTADGQPGGLSGTYFQSKTFEDKKLERRDASIAFNWDKLKNDAAVGENYQVDPVPGLAMDGFSARWEGFLLTKSGGEYRFQLDAGDSMRLWVDGKLVIERAKAGQPMAKMVTLPADAKVAVKLEYVRGANKPFVELRWQQPVSAAKAAAYTRNLYLPHGDWFDFWTGASLAGGRAIDTPAPLQTLPLFVRAGSIIPMGPNLQYAAEKPADPIELRIYRGADGAFTLYEDENDNYNYEKGAFATIPIAWSDANQTLTLGARTGEFKGMLKERTFNVVLVGAGHGIGGGVTAKPDQVVRYNGQQVNVSAK